MRECARESECVTVSVWERVCVSERVCVRERDTWAEDRKDDTNVIVATEQRIRKRSNWYWLVVKQMCAPKPTLLIV